MKLSKLKIYAPMSLLVAGLAFATPNKTVYAEETEVAAEAQSEEEILYEVTDETVKVVIEDIPSESEKSDEQKAQEAAAAAAEEAAKVAEAEQAKQEAAAIEAEKEQLEQIIGSTDIDPEDQSYNTGREVIPDTVLTEAERKGIDKIPNEPETPPTPTETPQTPTDTPETPTETPETPESEQPPVPSQTEVTPEPSKITYIPEQPKTGINMRSAVVGGASVFTLVCSGIGLYYHNRLENPLRITSSRKKYSKKGKKRNR